MKIYTGNGDKGKTSLFTGERVKKSNIRLQVYGDLDELNSYIGLLSALLTENTIHLKKELEQIQNHLFHIGSWIASTPSAHNIKHLEEISPEMIIFLEHLIDKMDKKIPSLKSFILPGGHQIAAISQITRTICRRVEREAVELFSKENYDDLFQKNYDLILVYINRLSDYLFILARFINFLFDVEEISWKK